MIPEPKHGKDGWELVSYAWDEKTGEARFQYRRQADRTLGGRMAETSDVTRHQMAWWTDPAKREDAEA